jgi:hypothetical protein
MAGIQLLLNNPAPRRTAGIGGTGHAKYHSVICQTAHRSGLYGRGANLIKRNLAKHLTKTLDVFIKQRFDCFWGGVSARKTRATRNKNCFYFQPDTMALI